jgi:hypothetical protein
MIVLLLVRLPDFDAVDISDYAKYLQQPQTYNHDHNDVEDGFDGFSHRDVGINRPQHDANDDQCNDDINQRHTVSFFEYCFSLEAGYAQ